MKAVMLRDVPKDVVKGINSYKQELGIKSTTTAIYGIVADYVPLIGYIEKLKAELLECKTLYNTQTDMILDYFRHRVDAELVKKDILRELKGGKP